MCEIKSVLKNSVRILNETAKTPLSNLNDKNEFNVGHFKVIGDDTGFQLVCNRNKHGAIRFITTQMDLTQNQLFDFVLNLTRAVAIIKEHEPEQGETNTVYLCEQGLPHCLLCSDDSLRGERLSFEGDTCNDCGVFLHPSDIDEELREIAQ